MLVTSCCVDITAVTLVIVVNDEAFMFQCKSVCVFTLKCVLGVHFGVNCVRST